jgi:bifunctional non-homologous end joining protein LigD
MGIDVSRSKMASGPSCSHATESTWINGFRAWLKALAALPGEFTVDGEVVALDAQGKPSFQLLQNGGSRLRSIYFYAFDLLNRDGVDLIRSPIERRREMLDKLFAAPTDPLRLSFLFQATAEQILDAVKKLGLEGVIGKRKGSIYEPGKRTGAPMRNHVNRLKCD